MRRLAVAVVSILVLSAAPAFAGDQPKPEGEEPAAEAVDATAAAAAVDAAAPAAPEAPKPKDKPEEEAAPAS